MKHKKIETLLFSLSLVVFVAIMSGPIINSAFATDLPVECYKVCTPPYDAACGDHGTVPDCNQSPCGTKYTNSTKTMASKCNTPIPILLGS
jgi:hypothetical protein